ncbi:hypothetical protein C8Q80DRAFT_1265994 [Daedaleopsis nitida]|nr:hypothetical protein C8Q80DRAFT_1265994 [Daedaleopsis nitida]
MASVASSSTPSGSTRQRSRRDIFKPKFPLDPFAGASAVALGEPWFLKIDALLSATAFQRRNVLFVLGAPTLQELGPLLQSRHMAKSLVILATHNPPDIPGIVIPTVRVLRLSSPLALEDAGAVRFVNVLEWAERVARAWRKHGGGGVVELSEDANGQGELAPPSLPRFGSQSTPTSPGSSSTHLSMESGTSSRPSSIAGSFFTRRGRASLPPPDPSQRPFDVLVNFLPDRVSDKALLKNSILVTTISRPFLTSTSAPTVHLWGLQSQLVICVYAPHAPYQSGESLSLAQMMLAPPGKALLIQLLPPTPPNAPPAARRKLVESMESFLLSFAFQASPAMSKSQALSSGPSDPLERARPYVMQSSTFCESIGCEPAMADYGDWTVADIILSGALDADTPSVAMNGAAPPTMFTSASLGAVPKATPKSSRRAWLATAADLIIMTFEKARSSSVPLLTTELTATLPTIRPSSHFAHVAPAVVRTGKGSYAPTSSTATMPSSGLPTPPHSEEEAHSTADSASLDARTRGASSTALANAAADSHGESVSGSAKKPRWKFWRRLGAGQHAPSTPVKA